MRIVPVVSVLLLVCLGPGEGGVRAQDCDGVTPAGGEAITLALVHPLLDRPVGVSSAPGDPSRLFILEQSGFVRVLDLKTGALLSAPFLSISSRVAQSGSEQGLLGLAFHPEWQTNRLFFVNYTRATDGATVIARFEIDPNNPNRALAGTEATVLTVAQPFSNHNGGHLEFDPFDGYLYIGLGDGGDSNDPRGHAQNPDSLLGKLLRIDVDPIDGESAYSIPPDNPYVADPGIRPEIWALGLRNPWRYSFDRETGDLYIADVGESAREEIDFVPADSEGGLNFEWKRREGTRIAHGSVEFGPGTLMPPIFEYSHTGSAITGCAIIGGVVYRGCALPDLRGTYFFADFCTERVYSLRVVDGQATGLLDRTPELNLSIPTTKLRSVSAFGTDANGEIYICDITGKLYKIVPRTENLAPTAVIRTDPSPPELLLLGEEIQIVLDASQSDDGDHGTQELTFAWEKLEGPEGDTILSPDAVATAVTFTEEGIYTYRATVSDGLAVDTAEVTVLVVRVDPTIFIRGDSNDDGKVDISDGIRTLSFLFVGGEGSEIRCQDAADANDSGTLDLSDGIFTFNYLFAGNAAPPAPGPTECGIDPTADLLPSCEMPLVCQ